MVTAPLAADTFTLDSSTGYVYHLNTIVPETNMSISGACGSTCGGGNPTVTIYMAVSDSTSQPICPSPWGLDNGDGENGCDLPPLPTLF